MRIILTLGLLIAVAGCGSEVALKSAPVSVSGKVSQSGQPLGGIMMTFHPLGDGHVRELLVQKDGTFQGELVSGEYAYYVVKPATPTAAPVLKKLAPKYFEADLARTVVVEPGQQLAIALD